MKEKAFNGKILSVFLALGAAEAEELPEQMYRDYLGGYGLGARLLFDRIPTGADPLGPENVLGLMPGLLTGTPFFGSRWQAVCKSPKNNGWGDANGGGDFGPVLKHAGWDGVLLYGQAKEPVYILIEDDKVEILDASDLWGVGAIDAEDLLKERHGKKASVAVIGQAGEKLSLCAGISNERGRLAARSAVGAVMGSKKVKAVVVKASRSTMASDKEILKVVRSALDKLPESPLGVDRFRTYGTTSAPGHAVLAGDSAIMNWSAAGIQHMPEAEKLNGDNFNTRKKKNYACWHCPVACGAESVASPEPKYPYPEKTHRPEYESAAAFGALSRNADIDSLYYFNHLCNQYGLDVISAGTAIAFAIECYEDGLITKEDTDGIELRWGATEAMVAMLHKMGQREGFGDVLADGVKVASERLGEKTKQFAMHIAGEEISLHDPRLIPDLYTVYKLDPTPARHTQFDWPTTFTLTGPDWGIAPLERDRNVATGRGDRLAMGTHVNHVINSTGLCALTMLHAPNGRIPEWIRLATGWDMNLEEVLRCGERIGNLRAAFAYREGDVLTRRHVPGRLYGNPPLADGPIAGVTLDVQTLEREYLQACGWDVETAKPSREKLASLGLEDVAEQICAAQRATSGGARPSGQ